jgi:YD repeat-containing protein
MATARLRGRRIEALSERSETSQTWVNPEGTRTTEVNNAPVRVRRGDAWVPVDLHLVKGVDGAIRPAAHPETVADQVRVKRVIGPVEPGVGDCTLPTPARGCEALEYEYATATTATATTPGDYTGQVRRILAWGTDPATATVSAVAVTQYAYNPAGQLLQVWDPRLATPITTSYTYDPAGHVISAGQSGTFPWFFDYGTAGTGDPNPGRLLKVRRPALLQGSPTTQNGEIATTIVYGAGLTRAAGGPVNLDGPTAATWAQTDVPTDATAIFGPEDPMTVNTATATAPGPDGYKFAVVHYLDSAAREVNTLTPGGYIDTREYDRFGNAIRELDAADRSLSLAEPGYPNAAGVLADLGMAGYDTATRATWLDTRHTYSLDGIDEIDALGPLHRIALDADPNQLVNARRHTTTVYDEGKPDGTVYHLPTTSQSSAQVVGLAGEQDVKVDKTDYTPAIGGTSGWVLRKPTKTTRDALAPAGPTGPAPATTRYDDQGRVRETRGVDATGADAATTLSIYWTAGANPDDAACGNRPEWAGNPCVTKAAAAVTGADPVRMPTDLPGKRVSSYSRYGAADRLVETAAGKTRTTPTTHAGPRTATRPASSNAASSHPTANSPSSPARRRPTRSSCR